jgi:hypothetical protein
LNISNSVSVPFLLHDVDHSIYRGDIKGGGSVVIFTVNMAIFGGGYISAVT